MCRHSPRVDCYEVACYDIDAQNGEIGHVEDFLVDDQAWSIRYLLVDTSNWIGGRTVLIAPEWARRIDWARQRVHVDVTREAVKDSPEYDPGAEIDRAYEERLAEVCRRFGDRCPGVNESRSAS